MPPRLPAFASIFDSAFLGVVRGAFIDFPGGALFSGISRGGH